MLCIKYVGTLCGRVGQAAGKHAEVVMWGRLAHVPPGVLHRLSQKEDETQRCMAMCDEQLAMVAAEAVVEDDFDLWCASSSQATYFYLTTGQPGRAQSMALAHGVFCLHQCHGRGCCRLVVLAQEVVTAMGAA